MTFRNTCCLRGRHTLLNVLRYFGGMRNKIFKCSINFFLVSCGFVNVFLIFIVHVIVYLIWICTGTCSVISTIFASWRRDISKTWNNKILRGRHILVTWYSGSRGGPELRVPESLGTLVCRSRPEQLGAGVTRITRVPDSRVTPGCRCHRTSCVPKSLGEPWCPSHSELRRAGVTWTQLCRRHS